MEKVKIKLCFIIVNWNRKAYLQQCLKSIQTHIALPHMILVVDNASTDGSLDLLSQEFPEIGLIKNSQNLGYGKANNIALRYLHDLNLNPEYCIFLNNDTQLIDSSLEELITFLDKSTNVTAATPAVFWNPHQLQTGVAGYELTLKSAFHYFFFPSILFPRKFKGFFIRQGFFRKQGLTPAVDWISGACLVARYMAVQDVIGFPEQFFMYAEDISFSRKLRQHGEIVFFSQAQIIHHQEDSHSPAQNTLWLDSLFEYYSSTLKKSPSFLRILLLKLIFLIGFVFRIVGYAVRSLFSKKKQGKRVKRLMIFCRHILSHLFK